MRKCKVIAVTNQKGGVGKTTTTENVAIGLSRQGFDVLIVDFDPQGDLTSCLGWKNNDALEQSISSMLDDYINDNEISYDSLILHHEEDVDLIPANIELADFEMRLVSVINREQTLSNCIEPLRDKYDYIFIDCPPSLGMLTVNALSAADEVLIPVQTQYLPAKGMTKLLQTVNKVQRKINSNLKITGIVMTLADLNTNITKSTSDRYQFTVIMLNLNYDGTQDVTQNVTQEDIYALILEMIKRNNKISAKQMSEKLGISIRTVRRKIKEMDNVEYIGHGYSGYWKIKK